MKKKYAVSIIIPLYNEELNIEPLINRLNVVILDFRQKYNEDVEVVFVNDGSVDGTLDLVVNSNIKSFDSKVLNLSRNFGHQPAVLAGLTEVKDSLSAMVIDGDLQDPPELLLDMYSMLIKGNDVVYAVRQKRKENKVLVFFYNLFYRVLNHLTNGLIPKDSGDFALMSTRVVDKIVDFPESQKFIRGLRAWVGFKQVPFFYERDARRFGSSKYSISMLFKLAKNGIFNFTDKPLSLINRIGLMSMMLGIIYFMVILAKKIIGIKVVDGFTSMVALFVFFTGVQLFSLGIIAEYIGRIFKEVKGRPTYIVEKVFELERAEKL